MKYCLRRLEPQWPVAHEHQVLLVVTLLSHSSPSSVCIVHPSLYTSFPIADEMRRVSYHPCASVLYAVTYSDPSHHGAKADTRPLAISNAREPSASTCAGLIQAECVYTKCAADNAHRLRQPLHRRCNDSNTGERMSCLLDGRYISKPVLPPIPNHVQQVNG